MKIKLLTFSLLFFISTSITQESKTDLLCGKKWYAKYATIDGIKTPIPPGEQNELWMLFYKDGKQVASVGDDKKIGQWKFSKNKDSIDFTTEAGKRKFMPIDTLTEKKLNLVFIDQNQKITIYFEKKE